MADDRPGTSTERRVGDRRGRQTETVWSFSRDGVFWKCELVNQGEWGVEARISRDDAVVTGLRFPTRASAIEWADAERAQHGLP